jgi:hypothetical protein
MNQQQRVINAVIDKVLAEWADKGKIIEGGWMAYVATSGLETASETQRTEMCKAYMLGAQHLFASIMGILDPGSEPTEKDLKRMGLIHNELEAFRRSLGN